MGAIAWMLDDSHHVAPDAAEAVDAPELPLLEWRVLVAVAHALPLFVRLRRRSPASARSTPTRYGVTPKSIYLTTLAVVILLTRPLSGSLADRIGYRRVFVPCLGADRVRPRAAHRARHVARSLRRVGDRLRPRASAPPIRRSSPT